MKKENVYMSECCKASYSKLDSPVSYICGGITYIEHYKCSECEDTCNIELKHLYDENGDEVKIGHILHCPTSFNNNGYDYHVVFLRDGKMEIRDLGANNRGMYNLDPFYIKGYYWDCLDILDDYDLAYYFNSTKELALTIKGLSK